VLPRAFRNRNSIVPVVAANLALASAALAQPGWVLSQQKISDTDGGFSGLLDNNDWFGWTVAALGDLDGDDVGDLAVGASQDDDGGTDRGAVWVLFLNPNGTVRAHQKISDTEGGFTGVLRDGDEFGVSAASLGDLDGDGVCDLAVGANLDDDGGNKRGAVWVLFLNTDGTVKAYRKISDTEGGFTGFLDDNDRFGTSVAALGDLDRDGVTDLAVGAIQDDDGGNNRGAVWVLFLNTDGTVKSYQKISDTDGGFTGLLTDEDWFGRSIAWLSDLDGNDVSDLTVGANLDSDGGDNRGAVWVLFLNTDGTVKSHQKISDTYGGFTGILDDNDRFGTSVAAPGDLDRDGVGDLAVGAQVDDDGGNDRGAVWVLFLNSNGTVKSHQKVSDTEGGFEGALDDADWFGQSVAALGDFDGDGVEDLAVGAGGDDDGGRDRGAVWVLFLDGVPAGPDLSILGSCPGAMRFSVQGATPLERVAYLYARGEGRLRIPDGSPCAGTTLGLNNTAQLADVVRADANGTANLDIPNVPNAACGHIYIQAIDLSACATSNVAIVD